MTSPLRVSTRDLAGTWERLGRCWRPGTWYHGINPQGIFGTIQDGAPKITKLRYQWFNYYRRKFRSQTSDNMDRWKAEMGRVKEKRRVEERRSEESQKKEDADARKGGKVTKHCVFQWFVALEGWSHLARWEMKNCTPLWREAHVEVKMYKTHHARTTFGSWDVEKVHAVVARSTCRSQKCTKHTRSGPLLEVAMSKKCTPLWREAHFEVKMHKTHQARTTFGSWDVEVHAVVAPSAFRSQNVKNTRGSDHLAKREGFVAFPKTIAGVGHLKRICKDAFRVAGPVQKTCSSQMLGGQGADFLRGVAFWSIRSVGLLRWFCVTGAALRMTWHQFFVVGAIL